MLMNKREFLKLFGAAAAVAVVSPEALLKSFGTTDVWTITVVEELVSPNVVGERILRGLVVQPDGEHGLFFSMRIFPAAPDYPGRQGMKLEIEKMLRSNPKIWKAGMKQPPATVFDWKDQLKYVPEKNWA